MTTSIFYSTHGFFIHSRQIPRFTSFYSNLVVIRNKRQIRRCSTAKFSLLGLKLQQKKRLIPPKLTTMHRFYKLVFERIFEQFEWLNYSIIPNFERKIRMPMYNHLSKHSASTDLYTHKLLIRALNYYMRHV